MRGGGQRKPAVRRNAAVGLACFETLLLKRFHGLLAGLAMELGPDRVVGAAEKRGIRARARYFAHALAAERKRQGKVVRHWARRFAAVAAAQHVVDHRTDKRPVPSIVRVELHGDVDLRHAGQRVGHAMNWIGMGHRAHDRGPVHRAGEVGQQFADVQPRQAGTNRLELAADFRWRRRLHVNGFNLARRAIEMQ